MTVIFTIIIERTIAAIKALLKISPDFPNPRQQSLRLDNHETGTPPKRLPDLLHLHPNPIFQMNLNPPPIPIILPQHLKISLGKTTIFLQGVQGHANIDEAELDVGDGFAASFAVLEE